MIRQSNHESQAENGANAADGDTSLNDPGNPTEPNGSQVDMHTLKKNIASKVRSEVDCVMTTV